MLSSLVVYDSGCFAALAVLFILQEEAVVLAFVTKMVHFFNAFRSQPHTSPSLIHHKFNSP